MLKSVSSCNVKTSTCTTDCVWPTRAERMPVDELIDKYQDEPFVDDSRNAIKINVAHANRYRMVLQK